MAGREGPTSSQLLPAKGYTMRRVERRSSSINTGRVDHHYQDPHVDNARFKLQYGDLTDSPTSCAWCRRYI